MKSFKDYAKILEEIGAMGCDGSYIDFEDVTELDRKMGKKFVAPLQNAGDEEWFENDELIGEYANAYACTGFINGFIRAMYLMYKATEAQEEAKAV